MPERTSLRIDESSMILGISFIIIRRINITRGISIIPEIFHRNLLNNSRTDHFLNTKCSRSLIVIFKFHRDIFEYSGLLKFFFPFFFFLAKKFVTRQIILYQIDVL